MLSKLEAFFEAGYERDTAKAEGSGMDQLA